MADPAGQTLAATRRLMWWLVVPVMVLLGLLTALQYHQGMADAEREMLRRAGERAQELDALARPAMAHVHDLRLMLEQRWLSPPDAGPALRQALKPRRTADGRPDGWSLDGANEVDRQRYGQLWWSDPAMPQPDERWLRRAQAFVEQAGVVHRRSPGFVATWFAAADVNLSFGYPHVPTAGIVAAMGTADLAGIAQPRQAAVQRVARIREQNPDDVTFWGPPYVGQLDGVLVMSHGASLVVGGRYVGEVSLDFRIDELQDMAQRWRREGGRVWVADAQRNVLADSQVPLAAPAASSAGGTDVRRALAASLPTGLGPTDLDAALFAPTQVHEAGGWVLATGLRIGSPFHYVEAMPAAQLRAQVLPTLLPNAVLAVALLEVFVLGQWLLSRWFVAPALGVLAYLRTLSQDPQAAPPVLGKRWAGWVQAVTDVFARQRDLQRSERTVQAFKSAMVDHAPTGIITTDGGEGVIVEFNDAACAMFGVSREQAIGRVVGDVIVPERQRAAHRAALQRQQAGEKVPGFDSPLQMQGLRADGQTFPIEIQTFKILVEGEIFYTGFVTDLSARQQAADQIARQREALRQSEKLTAMGSLLAGVAHELNNPLAIVMGRASLLEDKTAGSDTAEDARRIREAAERCGRIVRTFLNMARARPPQRGTVQVNDIARAAAEMLGYTLRSHGIELTLSLADDLPTVQADGDQIGQVVLNLVVNAQQALATAAEAAVGTPAGRRLARIALATGTRPGMAGGEPRVWLRVADTGPGVPADLGDRVFEPFFTTKAEGIGTGMGLAVSRGIAREHGGELSLEPGFGGGAVFELSLPISGTSETAAPAAGPADDSAPATARLLVVDDEPEIAELMRTLLEGAGYEVMSAESGAVALELLEMTTPDAIVSDLRMPDIDGATLWRTVRERWPSLGPRMLFVTGDTLSPGARSFLDGSGCPSLEKPFAKAALLAAVAQVLKG
ncbi:MAG: response regulator [Aquabacterium sp.]